MASASSFWGALKARTRNPRIPRCAIAHLRSGPEPVIGRRKAPTRWDHPGMTATPSFRAWIGNHAARHQPVPDEQHQQRADGCGDEAGALIRAVMADGLADESREKRAGN